MRKLALLLGFLLLTLIAHCQDTTRTFLAHYIRISDSLQSKLYDMELTATITYDGEHISQIEVHRSSSGETNVFRIGKTKSTHEKIPDFNETRYHAFGELSGTLYTITILKKISINRIYNIQIDNGTDVVMLIFRDFPEEGSL